MGEKANVPRRRGVKKTVLTRSLLHWLLLGIEGEVRDTKSTTQLTGPIYRNATAPTRPANSAAIAPSMLEVPLAAPL